MNENEAKTLIERFAEKQQGGHFACPRCGADRVLTDAPGVCAACLARGVLSLGAAWPMPVLTKRVSTAFRLVRLDMG